VKHTVATAKTAEWRDIPEFFTALGQRSIEILLVRGNHDGNIEPLLPENVKVLPSTGVVIGDVGFFHGHRWPSPILLGCRTLVMGHIHPIVVFKDPAGFRVTRQVWVKADCDGRLLSNVLKRKYNVKGKTEQTNTAEYDLEPVVRSSKLLIVPSFNDFLGGRPLNERTDELGSGGVVGPVLRSEAIDLKNAETYLLDGTYLGTLEQLKTLG
jgi:metallophosphoesterase superfamily enzyme